VNQVRRLPVNNPLIASKRQAASIGMFWYGVALFIVANAILLTNNEIINGAACQGIQLVALLLMVAGSVSIMNFKFDDKYLEKTFIIFMLYQLTVVARGIKFEYSYLKNLLL
jgi:hypothetical protein